MDPQILDEGLCLAMEWGENFLKPIQDRLKMNHPQLSDAEADECQATCKAAMHRGHGEVIACWRETDGQQFAASQLFNTRMLNLYPWISKETLGRLFSQGCYYGWKDGELS